MQPTAKKIEESETTGQGRFLGQLKLIGKWIFTKRSVQPSNTSRKHVATLVSNKDQISRKSIGLNNLPKKSTTQIYRLLKLEMITTTT